MANPSDMANIDERLSRVEKMSETILRCVQVSNVFLIIFYI